MRTTGMGLIDVVWPGRGGGGSLKLFTGVLVHRVTRPLRGSVSGGSGWSVPCVSIQLTLSQKESPHRLVAQHLNIRRRRSDVRRRRRCEAAGSHRRHAFGEFAARTARGQPASLPGRVRGQCWALSDAALLAWYLDPVCVRGFAVCQQLRGSALEHPKRGRAAARSVGLALVLPAAVPSGGCHSLRTHEHASRQQRGGAPAALQHARRRRE